MNYVLIYIQAEKLVFYVYGMLRSNILNVGE